MKLKIATTIMAALAYVATMAQAPSFPGAEGHGRYVPGGRGGNVVHVTNLNDSGSGSLREAVKGNEKKIIVFDVGGVIALTKELVIGDNTTIAGQTAPWPGITLRYYTVRPGNNNVIRFIRIRRGQEKDVNDGADAIWNREKTQMMLDHCSFSWSIDEVASLYDNNNFTMQWCTIAESLVHPGHSKGAHGYGGIWGGKLASFHHNLIAHVANRSPRFNGARYVSEVYKNNTEYSKYNWANAVQSENVDFRNCIIYNCGNGCYGGPGGGQINMVNNYYKTGPAGKTQYITTVSVASSGNSADKPALWGMTSRYYISGNQLNNTSNADWNYVNYDSGVYTINGEKWSKDVDNYYGSSVEHRNNSSGESCVRIKMDQSAPTGEVTTHSAAKAFDQVLAYAGASLDRDDVDTRYATEARNGTATYKGSATSYTVEQSDGTIVTYSCTPTWGRIDLVSDVNGYTEANFGTGSRASNYDTDRDGMPNAWETAHGLNPNDASDGATYTLDQKKYYCNLEVYLNSIVQDIMVNENTYAQEAVKEYYPAYTKEDGTKVAAINGDNETPTGDATYTIAANTYQSSPTDAEWVFAEGITVTNGGGKKYGAGLEDGVKYSAGVQFTISLPEGFKVKNISVTGYDNYAEADAYLSEINGTDCGTQYLFPKKDSKGNYTLKTYDINFDEAVTEKLTFTPSGKQVVLAITLNGTYDDEEENPKTPMEYTIAQDTYESSPSETEWLFAEGITVTNSNKKAYSFGYENGIKYSAGVQYTIHLPEEFHATSVTFIGYDNYKETDAYLSELNGTTYSSTQYVYPQKDSNGNYTVASHTVSLATEATGTLTFTPAGKQVVWTITINGYIGGNDILMGDANLDGEVSLTDIMLVVDYILGNTPEVFGFKNADMDGSNDISLIDIMEIVNIILEQ